MQKRSTTTSKQKKTGIGRATKRATNASRAANEEFNLLSNADYFFSTYMAERTLTQKGKDVTLKILEAARSILVEKGYGSLTLRDVAREAGVRLSNLQYYYPTRDDLIQDLLPLVFSVYEQRYMHIAFCPGISAEEKLAKMTRYLLANIREPSIIKLFFELWALSQRSTYVADLLSEMYTNYCRRIEDIISEISPTMPAKKRTERAILIAFLIEGIMVHLNISSARADTSSNFDKECVEQVRRLAIWP